MRTGSSDEASLSRAANAGSAASTPIAVLPSLRRLRRARHHRCRPDPGQESTASTSSIPNTGEVRSDGAEGIACWFIDTDYNEESFFVRHAYFLGANDPYKSLKTTLKAEINEEAWESLHSDTSRPFDKPKSGRIAVKVINHLGDEVMKVFRDWDCRSARQRRRTRSRAGPAHQLRDAAERRAGRQGAAHREPHRRAAARSRGAHLRPSPPSRSAGAARVAAVGAACHLQPRRSRPPALPALPR